MFECFVCKYSKTKYKYSNFLICKYSKTEYQDWNISYIHICKCSNIWYVSVRMFRMSVFENWICFVNINVVFECLVCQCSNVSYIPFPIIKQPSSHVGAQLRSSAKKLNSGSFEADPIELTERRITRQKWWPGAHWLRYEVIGLPAGIKPREFEFVLEFEFELEFEEDELW